MNRLAAMVVVVVMAIAGGVTAAGLTMVAAYLWRPLPYPAADRLVVVEYPRANGPSPRDLMTVDAGALDTTADLRVASDPDSFTVIGGDTPFTVDGRWTSGDVFAMFNVTPVIGRMYTRDEAMRGDPIALIGYDIWQERFGGRADVIGRPITIRATLRRDGPETFTIVGVLPRRFWHVEEQTSLMLPLKGARAPWLMRLRDHIPHDEAGRRVTAMVRDQVRGISPSWSVTVRSARDAHIDPVRPMLAAATWGVILLAIVTLANMVFLQLARGVTRRREIAVRAVLGASHRDLLWQFVTDGLVAGAIASIGATLLLAGFLTAGTTVIESYLGRLLPDGASLALDWRIYLVTWAGMIGAAVALHLVMLAAARSATLAAALSGSQAGTDPPRHLFVRQTIVATQIAVAFCLLVAAGLMVRTAWHLGRLELGFDARAVLSANLTLSERTYRTLDGRRDFFRGLTERLRRLPDVESAGLTSWLPFRVGPSITVLPEDAPSQAVAATMQGVDDGYFSALKLRLRDGRFLNEDDRPGRDNAMVVSRSLARALWGNDSPLGRKVRIKFSAEPGRGFGPYTVVGEVDEVLQSVMSTTPPQAYVSFYQQPLASNAFLQVRTQRQPLALAPAVARLVREMDPELALGSIATLESIVDRDGLRPRALARGLTAFALLALAIAIVGLSAVSVWIAQLRQREAALRIALGAERRSVVALLARRGLIASLVGLLIGWMAALPLTAAIASEIRGVSPNDTATRLIVAMLLMSISAAALVIPAWRASTSNLAALLRAD